MSPDSLKQSSDGKMYTSMTVSGSETIDSDPSPAKPAVFVDEYAAETKEGGRRGPHVDSRTGTTATCM